MNDSLKILGAWVGGVLCAFALAFLYFDHMQTNMILNPESEIEITDTVDTDDTGSNNSVHPIRPRFS